MSDWHLARVESVETVAEDVLDIVLQGVDGTVIAAAEPGAHIDIRLSCGLIRQYSIHQYDRANNRYRIGVGLASPSRGGSSFIHENIEAGQTVEISLPRNHFALDVSAPSFVFIAGGIGITPILSMIRWCVANDRPWRLLYCVRSQGRAAYYQDIPKGTVFLHADDAAKGRPDLRQFIGEPGPEEHLYCCGPGPLMDAVADIASSVMSPGNIHFERFAAPVASANDAAAPEDCAFTVKLAQSGLELTVPAESSVLDALDAAGVMTPFSCREGLCRTCECTVLEGEVDHRDYVLSDQERASNQVMLLCVSRAKSATLVLDL